MKQTIIATILTLALIACKKSSPIQETEKSPFFIRVAAPDGASITYSNVAIVKSSTQGNGGQDNENNYGKLVYVGYESGQYVLELSNKQSCGIDFEVKWLGKDTTIFVPGSSTSVIQLPGVAKGNEKIKAKPMYQCGTSGGDMGWVEIETPSNLPVTFKSIRCESIGKKQIKVIFEVADLKDVDVFYIESSTDGNEYKTAALVFPDEINPNKQYSVIVNL